MNGYLSLPVVSLHVFRVQSIDQMFDGELLVTKRFLRIRGAGAKRKKGYGFNFRVIFPSYFFMLSLQLLIELVTFITLMFFHLGKCRILL